MLPLRGNFKNHFSVTIFLILLNFGGPCIERYKNHNMFFYNHKNKTLGLKTSFYSNLETSLQPILFWVHKQDFPLDSLTAIILIL